MLKDSSNIPRQTRVKLTAQQNPYEKIKLIGKGTFGKVYHVINSKDKREYALKEVVQDSRYKNRELQITASMNHQNIISMEDYFFTVCKGDCLLHIIMPFMETSLASVLVDQRKRREPIPLSIRKLLAFQLFKGLYYLNINRVCHRDLKPPNILVNLDHCQLKICDFGSAKVIEIKQNNVSYICSRYYRAPELILNSSTYGCEVDMWSAGCIIGQFLSLEPFFPGDSSMEQLIEIVKICGTPTRKEVAKFSKQNAQIQLPKLKKTDLSQILSRYKPQKEQVDLISKILTYDVQKRLSPFEALTHPFFRDLKNLPESQHLQNLFDFSSLSNSQNRREVRTLSKMYSPKETNEAVTCDSSPKE